MVVVCLVWLWAVISVVLSQSGTPWGLYIYAALFALPALLFLLSALLVLWTRQLMVLRPAEQELLIENRSPFRTTIERHSLDGLRCIHITPWRDDKVEWYVSVQVGDRPWISFGNTPRYEDAHELALRLSAVLGVPVERATAS